MQFVGIDYEFLNLVYFQDETEKIKFISELKRFIDLMGVSIDMNFSEVIDKVIEYEDKYPEEEIDLIRKLFLFNGVFEDEKGKKKINNYYGGLNFAYVNVRRKSERECSNFEFEDNLIETVLKESELYNYARIQTLTFLGISHSKCGNLQKAEFYYNQIVSNLKRYELEPTTISQFLKEIAEYYYVISDFKNALDYYELGIELNPKLAVKKRIIELKSILY